MSTKKRKRNSFGVKSRSAEESGVGNSKQVAFTHLTRAFFRVYPSLSKQEINFTLFLRKRKGGCFSSQRSPSAKGLNETRLESSSDALELSQRRWNSQWDWKKGSGNWILIWWPRFILSVDLCLLYSLNTCSERDERERKKETPETKERDRQEKVQAKERGFKPLE